VAASLPCDWQVRARHKVSSCHGLFLGVALGHTPEKFQAFSDKAAINLRLSVNNIQAHFAGDDVLQPFAVGC